MFSRVTLLEIDTLRTSVDDALELFKQQVLPELREQEGYEGVVVMATPEGKGLIVTLWDSEEAAEAHGEDGFYSDVLARYMTLFRSPPGRERYRVAFAEVPAVTTG